MFAQAHHHRLLSPLLKAAEKPRDENARLVRLDFIGASFFCCFFHWIGLRENLHRKPWFLPLNIGVSRSFFPVKTNPMILNSPLCGDDLGAQVLGHWGMCAMAFSEDDQPELEEIEDDPQDDADEKSLMSTLD